MSKKHYVYEVVSNDFHDILIKKSHGLFRTLHKAQKKVKNPNWVIALEELGGEDWILKTTDGTLYGDSWYYLFQGIPATWSTVESGVPLGSLEVWINKREVE